MSECKNLTQEITIMIYTPMTKWYHHLPFSDKQYPDHHETISVSASSFDELQKKIEEVRNSFKIKYPNKEVWIIR